MEAPSRVEELLARAIDEQVAEHRSWQAALDDLGARVGRLEAAVERMRAELRVIAEEGARAGVAGELEAVSTELRRQISDLGRMIVRDLGRLPKLLREGGPGVPAPVPAGAPPAGAGATSGPAVAAPARTEAPTLAAGPAAPPAGGPTEGEGPTDEERRGLFRRR